MASRAGGRDSFKLCRRLVCRRARCRSRCRSRSRSSYASGCGPRRSGGATTTPLRVRRLRGVQSGDARRAQHDEVGDGEPSGGGDADAAVLTHSELRRLCREVAKLTGGPGLHLAPVATLSALLGLAGAHVAEGVRATRLVAEARERRRVTEGSRLSTTDSHGGSSPRRAALVASPRTCGCGAGRSVSRREASHCVASRRVASRRGASRRAPSLISRRVSSIATRRGVAAHYHGGEMVCHGRISSLNNCQSRRLVSRRPT